jgi:multiple sugar transport system substrate-binding protein
MKIAGLRLATAGAAAAALVTMTACSSGLGGASASSSAAGGSGSGNGGGTLTLLTDNADATVKAAQSVVSAFEKANPGVTINLQPITASENDYYTKLQLQMRTPKTSPDVVYEDTFLINSDIEAGYLRPLDDQLGSWSEWNQFTDTAKGAARALDGKTYGVPDGTDTRAIWFNKEIFAKAGLPADWQPKTWDDLLTAARTIKAKVPDVIPFNIYAGKGLGEATSMQGFEMLLYGTGATLYDNNAKKWVTRCSSSRPSTTRSSARHPSRCWTRTGTTTSASS